jgi:hypothetical protein
VRIYAAVNNGVEVTRADLMTDWMEIRDRIDTHLRATAAVIRANLDRWSR